MSETPSYAETKKTERTYIWAFACAVVTIVAILATCITYAITSTSHAAIEAGLEQRTLPGRDGVYWVRPDGGESGEGRGE